MKLSNDQPAIVTENEFAAIKKRGRPKNSKNKIKTPKLRNVKVIKYDSEYSSDEMEFLETQDLIEDKEYRKLDFKDKVDQAALLLKHEISIKTASYMFKQCDDASAYARLHDLSLEQVNHDLDRQEVIRERLLCNYLRYFNK